MSNEIESPGFNPEAKFPIDYRVATLVKEALLRLFDPGLRVPTDTLCEVAERAMSDGLEVSDDLEDLLADHFRDWMYEAFERWPGYSGKPAYPVPDPDGGKPNNAFTEALEKGDLYTGAYGRQRLALASFLISSLSLNMVDRNLRIASYCGDDPYLLGLPAAVMDRAEPRQHRVVAKFLIQTLTHPAGNLALQWYDYDAHDFEDFPNG